MRATMSLLGLYDYDPSILDDMQIPDDVDRPTLVDNLLIETAELELLYTDPEVLKKMIRIWSAKEQRVWKDLALTLTYEYDPISNYDRHEEWDDLETRDLQIVEDSGQTTTETRDLESTSNIDTTNNDTVTNDVAGYDASGPVFRDRSTTDGEGNSNGTSTDTGTVTNESDFDRSMEDTGTVANHHSGRLHGNIGVTTTQAMIEEQRRVVEFNIYDYIIRSFINRFCLLIY